MKTEIAASTSTIRLYRIDSIWVGGRGPEYSFSPARPQEFTSDGGRDYLLPEGVYAAEGADGQMYLYERNRSEFAFERAAGDYFLTLRAGEDGPILMGLHQGEFSVRLVAVEGGAL